MNQLSAKKLLNSKWTATTPFNKEKHFVISDVEYDEDGLVTLCLIEAIMSKRVSSIHWHDLKDSGQWQQGWK